MAPVSEIGVKSFEAHITYSINILTRKIHFIRHQE